MQLEALFAAAVNEDRSDATAWMQWGQWEKRVQGPEIARDMFRNGLKAGRHVCQDFCIKRGRYSSKNAATTTLPENCFPTGAKRAVILPNSGTATLRLRRIAG